MTIRDIAMVAHNANRALCEAHGDFSQQLWHSAPEWQRDSAVRGIRFLIEHPDAGPGAQHEAWCIDKLNEGWRWGPIKDANLKTHPCLVSYDELPVEQRAKDHVFQAVVASLLPFLTPEGEQSA